MRSIGAVLFGWLIFAVSTIVLFKLAGRDPHASASQGFVIFGTLCGMAFAVASGFVAAWLAGAWEVEHSLALSTIIAAAGAASLLSNNAQGAHWSEIAALLIIAPMAMVGGYIRIRQLGKNVSRLGS